TFDWKPVLKLCSWVVEQPREIKGRRSEYSDLDSGWGWTRKSIAELLGSGFNKGNGQIFLELRNIAWDVLKPLTEDSEPTPEYEDRYGGSNMDPATLSINTTRPQAIHATVRYAMWVYRHAQEGRNEKDLVVRGFDGMPEVREVLDVHLDPLN